MLQPYQPPETAAGGPLLQAQGWHLAAGVPDSRSGQPIARVRQLAEGSFDDPVLERLLLKLDAASLPLRQAEARLRQAQAVLAGAGARGWPELGLGLEGGRSGSSVGAGRGLAGQAAAAAPGSASGGAAGGSTLGGTGTGRLSGRSAGTARSGPSSRMEVGARISWTPDLWGRVAAQVGASEASAEVARADLAAVGLQLQLRLVQAYWRMRLAEQRLQLLARSVAAAERSLQLTRNQYEAGLVARADVLQAETQRQLVLTRRHALMRSRASELHAIAALLGQTPATLELPPQDAPLPAAPRLPGRLSIDVLRRRPDVRMAERRVAIANAGVGIARGAWLPDLHFSTSAGLAAETLATLLSSPLRSWSLGSQLAAVLFDGGARRAALAEQEAAYDGTVAAYRQQVLDAIKEIEDALLARRTLAEQARDQQRLVELAEAAERVVRNRYRSGLINYLELASAERLTIDSRDELLLIRAQQLAAHADLLAALGGSLPAGAASH